jgi:hypothetical protein
MIYIPNPEKALVRAFFGFTGFIAAIIFASLLPAGFISNIVGMSLLIIAIWGITQLPKWIE